MPFGDDLVEINYQAIVTGMGEVQALSAANESLTNQQAVNTSKINEATAIHEKHKNALLQTHTALRQFHRELFVGALALALVTTTLSSMANGSESAQIGLEKLKGTVNSLMGKFADATVFVFNFYKALLEGRSLGEALATAQKKVDGARSLDTQIKLLNMESQTAKIMGDERLSLQKKQEAEQTALKKDGITARFRILKDGLDKEQAAENEAFRLHSMGLKQQAEIESDFRKGIGGNFTSGGADIIDKFLTGQKQTLGDIAKSFTDGFAKTISKALSESFFSSLSSGKGFGDFFHNFMNTLTGKKDDPVKETNRILSNQDQILKYIQDCVCRTARATEAMAACGCSDNSKITSATITPGKIPTAARLATAFGGIGNAANALLGLPGLGGGGIGGGGSPAPMPLNVDLSAAFMNPEIKHSGGEIHKFPSGGEVPIMAQPGEFVVRKSAAQDNMDLLKSINSGARQSKQAHNIYFITSNDAKSFSDMLTSPSSQAQMEIQITKAILKNGQLRETIRNFARS